MTLKQLKEILEESRYPVAYRMFAKQTLPTMPFIVYHETNSNHYEADNKVYQKVQEINVDLYTQTKNETAENKIETLLDNSDIIYVKYESYLQEEKAYMITYTIQILK